MGKPRSVTSSIVLFIVLAVAVAACGSSGSGSNDAATASTSGARGATAEVAFRSEAERGLPSEYPEPKADKDLTIAYSSPLQANENVNVLGQAIEATTKSLGGSSIVLDAKASPDQQVSDMEQLIARGVDGIVVWPLDANALRPALAKAKAAGIPVIGVEASPDGRDPGQLYASQILVRRDYMSYLQAKAAAERLGPGAKVGQIGFAVPVQSITYAVERAKYWAEQFGLEVVGESSNPSDDIAGGETAMTQLLGETPDLEGVIAYNEESATGAAAAARAQGRRDLVLIGNNGGSLGFESVKAGKIDATVQIQTPYIGQQAVWGLYDIAAGGRTPRTILGGTPLLVDEETIDEVEPWSDTLATLSK